MPTTKCDLQAIHYLAQRLREETRGAGTWHDNGLTPVLAKLEGHNLLITIERVTRHAADPEARTPAAIERPFTPEPVAAGPRFPARAGVDECRIHPGEHDGACRACAADSLAGDRPEPRPREGSEPTEGYRAARAATQQTAPTEEDA